MFYAHISSMSSYLYFETHFFMTEKKVTIGYYV